MPSHSLQRYDFKLLIERLEGYGLWFDFPPNFRFWGGFGTEPRVSAPGSLTFAEQFGLFITTFTLRSASVPTAVVSRWPLQLRPFGKSYSTTVDAANH